MLDERVRVDEDQLFLEPDGVERGPRISALEPSRKLGRLSTMPESQFGQIPDRHTVEVGPDTEGVQPRSSQPANHAV